MQDDIQIDHSGGETIIRGIDSEKVKCFRDGINHGSGNGALHFEGVKKICRIRPDGSPHQTIYGEELA